MRNPFRRRNKKDKAGSGGQSSDFVIPIEFRPAGAGTLPLYPPTRNSAYLLAHLPPKVLERIFGFVCPHALDESYDTCEGSASSSNSVCMLCDLRDLGHCVQVCRAWRPSAVKVLYHSVRIDPVHYCRLEEWLADKRKKTSRFDRNGVPEDPAQARLRLLRRTVRDDPTRIGKSVQYLKLPYMLRESSQVELAQTIAVLPNLRYVDLPEGMFCDDPHYATLRLEVQARCPNLRKMTYVGGAERSLAMLATGQVWPNIEVLELNDLDIDPMTLRAVLGCLNNLQALKVSNTPGLSDEVLSSSDGLPTLPPMKELVLKDTPGVTLKGLIEYLAWQETQQALTVLTLKDTGVHPASLQEIFTMASSLRTFAIQSQVSEQFPNSVNSRPLASRSLETLRFEVSPSSNGAFSSVTMGYYSYLASSILGGGFPKLRQLYVHDESFPDQLQGLPPPNAAFAGGHTRSGSNTSTRSSPGFGFPAPSGLSPPSAKSPPFAQRRPVSNIQPASKRFSSNNPFAPRNTPLSAPTHTLEVFTKSDEFGKWNFVSVDPLIKSATAPSRRPMSSYGLAADVTGSGWDRGDARRSVMVGNGTGVFLAVPGQGGGDDAFNGSSDSWRPQSSGGSPRRSRELW
ncbi:related to F-box domain protein [Fusarium torulosum]|uniref:Related to F-box domain protein n=1 Tax=Fusarium torulosum TaxID=33205 RepID=A0AAE8M647_9HYPO|nr:related to F-box domain protein [Fusarium torulosum]